MKKLLFFLGAALSLPGLLTARYIDTRDITPEIKQVQRLLGAKRSSSGSGSAAAVLAMGAGLAFVGAAHRPSYYGYGYRPYGYRPYRGPYHYGYYSSPYYYGPGPLVAVGGIMAAAGVAAAAEANAVDENNADIERKIAQIIGGLVNGDEDYIKEAQTLNGTLSNEGAALIARIDQRAEAALAGLSAPSNRMEQNLQASLEALKGRHNLEALAAGLNGVSNQILGIEPASKSSSLLKDEAKTLSKALKAAEKQYLKDSKALNRAAAKERKALAKTYKKQAEAVLSERESAYKVFVDRSTKQIEELFQRYYKAYHAKIM